MFYYRRSEFTRIVNLLSVVFLVREGPLGTVSNPTQRAMRDI